MSFETFRRLITMTAVAALCACSAKRVAVKDKAGKGAADGEPPIHGFQFAAHPSLEAAFFETDRAGLTDEALAVLKRNAAEMKKHPEWEMLVEGHCDQRGTNAYNLALGQKRAKAVRDYYLMLGVPGDRVATRSFGEEMLACAEDTPVCWARNRRAESKLKVSLARKGSASGT